MTLEKITIIKNVRCINRLDHSHSHTEQAPPISKERDGKPNTRKKNASNNQLSQKNKKCIDSITTGGRFLLRRWKMNGYFQMKNIHIVLLNKHKQNQKKHSKLSWEKR